MDYKTLHTLTGALISFQEFMETTHGISDITEVDRNDPVLLASAESWAKDNEYFQQLLFK